MEEVVTLLSAILVLIKETSLKPPELSNASECHYQHLLMSSQKSGCQVEIILSNNISMSVFF